MKKVQFGLCLPVESRQKMQPGAYLDDLHSALNLAKSHFDSAWLVDHLQFEGTDVLESFTTLSYLAALYPELKFGHGVVCQSFRNPALLAKMAATLQFISDGRYILGIGAGWHEQEYRAYGYDFPADGIRVDQLEEAVQIIRALWTEEKTTFRGRHYQVVEARCEPKLDSSAVLMIGAFKPRMLHLAVQYADWWDVSSIGVKSYRNMVEIIDLACDKTGRDPSSLKRIWSGGCACAPSREAAETLAGDRISSDAEDDDFGFVGTPEQIIEQMQPFIDLGVDYFRLDCIGFPDLTSLKLLIEDVIPFFDSV